MQGVPRWTTVVLFAGLVTTVAALAQPPAFEPRTVIPRAFPAIKDPNVVPADQAGTDVRDQDLVLGVVVEGEARAYPINMLVGPRREIINDDLGGRAIAATW